MVEYALLLSLVALALVGTIGGMAGQIGGRFNAISNTLATGGNGGLGPGPSTPDGGGGGTTPPPTTDAGGSGNNNGGGTDTGNNNSSNPSNNGVIDPSKTPLDKVTPEQLDKLSPDAAKNPDKYKPWIGQSMYVKINGIAYPFVLIGVAHDDLADGSGKAGFTFKANAIVGYISKSSNGMWDKTDGNGSSGKTTPSYLRIAMRDDVFPKIEDSYKNVIKEVKKEIDYGLVDIDKGDHYKTANLITTRDKLWALSLTEILGNSYREGVIPNYLDYKVDLDNTNQYHEGSQYEYFDKLTVIGSDTAERLLDVPTSFSDEKIYGLRTNTYSYTGSLAVYKTSGYTNETLNVWNFRNNLNMTERIGILPCFCI